MHFHAVRQAAALSPHPTEKIAAQIVYSSGEAEEPRCNARPPIIEAMGIAPGTKIANRSLYVHAETRALLHARRSTRGATLIVTDPFCPNCAKQIAMAGIAKVVVDRQGFEKRYYQKNIAAFAELSHAILAWAGVAVYVANEDGSSERLIHNAPVIKSAMKMKDVARLRVSGSWCGTRWIVKRGIAFDGPAFTHKYDARIEAATVAIMTAKRKGLLPKSLQPLTISEWPDTPRVFIDALELGIENWRVLGGEKPAWTAELPSIGIKIED